MLALLQALFLSLILTCWKFGPGEACDCDECNEPNCTACADVPSVPCEFQVVLIDNGITTDTAIDGCGTPLGGGSTTTCEDDIPGTYVLPIGGTGPSGCEYELSDAFTLDCPTDVTFTIRITLDIFSGDRRLTVDLIAQSVGSPTVKYRKNYGGTDIACASLSSESISYDSGDVAGTCIDWDLLGVEVTSL